MTLLMNGEREIVRECRYLNICQRFDDKLDDIDRNYCFAKFERCDIYITLDIRDFLKGDV